MKIKPRIQGHQSCIATLGDDYPLIHTAYVLFKTAVGPSIHGCVIFIAAMDHLILFTVCCDWFLIVDFDKLFKVCDQRYKA